MVMDQEYNDEEEYERNDRADVYTTLTRAFNLNTLLFKDETGMEGHNQNRGILGPLSPLAPSYDFLLIFSLIMRGFFDDLYVAIKAPFRGVISKTYPNTATPRFTYENFSNTLEFNKNAKQHAMSMENDGAARYQRFQNPIFRYNYKSGNYLPKFQQELYAQLFTSVNELVSGLRPAS
jgi:hypothetical protein